MDCICKLGKWEKALLRKLERDEEKDFRYKTSKSVKVQEQDSRQKRNFLMKNMTMFLFYFK